MFQIVKTSGTGESNRFMNEPVVFRTHRLFQKFMIFSKAQKAMMWARRRSYDGDNSESETRIFRNGAGFAAGHEAKGHLVEKMGVSNRCEIVE